MKTAKCFLCSEIFNEPKTLPCLHSFCLACLDKLVRTEIRRREVEIRCPVCQSSIPIPEGNSFIDLRTSFHLDQYKDIMDLANGKQRGPKCSNCDERKAAISFCYSCQDYLCWRCDHAHQRLRSTRDHHNVFLEHVESLLLKPVVCSQDYHEEKPLDRFCNTCLECVCRICCDEAHRKHDVVNVKQTAKRGKIELKETLENVEQELSASKKQMKENLVVFECRKKEIDTARGNVEEYVDECIQSLEEYKEAVLTKLDDIQQQQQRSHAIKQRELKLFVTQLRNTSDHGKGVLKRNVDVEIVKERQAVIESCEDLLNVKHNWKPYQLPFVAYLIDNEIYERVQEWGLGRVSVSTTDASQSVADGAGLSDPLLNKENSFEIVTRDLQGHRCYNEEDELKVKIQDQMGKELRPTLKDKKNGKYRVTFTPKVFGQYEIRITVNERALTGSPWSVIVTHQYQRVSELASAGYGDGQFSFPCGIAISHTNGNIMVANQFSSVQVFTSQGRFLRKFGNTRDGTKNLKSPYSVAFSPSGSVIVIDSNRMIFCSSTGVFLWYVGEPLVEEPHSVSVSSDGKLIVCDRGDNKVKVLSSDGQYLIRSIFCDPNFNGQPSFAIHHEDKFFVSYQEKHHVKVFNENGVFLYSIGAEGCDEEKLRSPLGLAIDRFNNLVVCDTRKSRLQVFKTDGRHVSTVRGDSSQLASPHFVAVSRDGYLYVTDQGNKKLFVVGERKDCVHVFY